MPEPIGPFSNDGPLFYYSARYLFLRMLVATVQKMPQLSPICHILKIKTRLYRVLLLVGGDAENRTPVQRRSHNNVYSLDDIYI